MTDERLCAALVAMLAEPHHLGFPVSGRTGTYDGSAVMVKRDWYERLRALAVSATEEPTDERDTLRAALERDRPNGTREVLTHLARPAVPETLDTE